MVVFGWSRVGSKFFFFFFRGWESKDECISPVFYFDTMTSSEATTIRAYHVINRNSYLIRENNSRSEQGTPSSFLVLH